MRTRSTLHQHSSSNTLRQSMVRVYRFAGMAVVGFMIALSGCSSSSNAPASQTTQINSLSIAPLNGTLIARQDATPVSDSIILTRSAGDTAPVTLSASCLPTGLTATFTQFGTGNTGMVTFAAATVPAAAGTYAVSISATDGQVTASTSINVTVAVVLTLANAVDTTIGLSGHLQQFMSTNVLPNPPSNSFFVAYPSTKNLAALQSQHIRIQPVIQALPWVANSSPQVASDWSFSGLDDTLQPMLTIDDYSPMLQIAQAPGFLNDSSSHFIFNSTNLALLTTYVQNLVRYYNAGGFTYAGQHFQSAGTRHITWWAIFNEPNINNLTPAQYVTMYNTLVPAMLAIDSTLKFSALELSDFSGQPQTFLPTLVQPAASGGLNAQVNAIATHFYGTCAQTTADSSLFSGLTQFSSDISYFRSELATRADLANVPVWVTEHNVNSAYALSNGNTSCPSGGTYVLDKRATSTFFTAYRPLAFSEFGKAGSQSLYHYSYEGNQAYGEVNSTSAALTIGYWVDYWLEQTFPWNGTSTGSLLYKTTNTEPTPTVDILAVLNADTSVSLMVTNYAVASSTDNNGAGINRTIYVNLAALGSFSSGTEVDLNGSTSPTAGPVSYSIDPGNMLTLNIAGYGTSMFVLKH